MVADLIEFDVRLAQGYAISEPRPVKPEAFLPPAAQAAAPQGGAAPTGPAQNLAQNPAVTRPAPPAPTRPEQPAANAASEAPQRLPLRAVLRRA
jgi:hypothetical protein